MVDPALQEELHFYNENREEYLQKYPEQFLVIKGKRMASNHSSYQAALQAGINEFEAEPFLIKHVLDPEPSAFFLSGNV